MTCSAAPAPVAVPASGSGGTAAGNTAAGTGNASSGSIGAAIGNAFGARGGGAQTVSRNGLFLSTFSSQGVSDVAGGAAPGAAWLAIQGTRFNGTLEGNGVEVTFGADFEVSNGNYIGGILSYGAYDVTSGAVNSKNTGLSFGPYASFGINDRYRIDAYAVVARPRYETGAVSYHSERLSLGLNARANYEIASIATSSLFGLKGFKEDLPATAPGGARTVSSFTASISTRMDFQPQQPVRPWLSMGADATRFQDGGTTLNSLSPSVGAGLAIDGRLGVLSIGLNNAQIFQGARATNLSANWSMSF